MAVQGGGGFGSTTTPKKKKIVTIKLPGDPGYVAPTGSTAGVPIVPTAPKIKTLATAAPNPNPTLGEYSPNPSSAPGFSAASTPVGPGPSSYNGSPVNGIPDRTPRDNTASNNTGGISNPMSGFASRYDPTKLDPLYDDSNIILNDLLGAKGMGGGSGVAQMGDYANRIGNLSLLLSLVQSGQNPDAGNDEHYINTIAELLNNSMGPGGSQMDYSSILKMLLNPQAGGALSTYLYGDLGDANGDGVADNPLTVAQQDQMLNPMYLGGITGMNPAMQRAMANVYNGASRAASSDVTHGAQNPQIVKYLKDKLAGIIPGL